MRGRWAGSALGVVSAAIPAMGDVVTLNFWDASLNYGVFADGGSLPSPVQGPETMAIGSSSLVWERTGGVAYAGATADYRLGLVANPTGPGPGTTAPTAPRSASSATPGPGQPNGSVCAHS